jgi:hypothetical protein
VILPFAVCDPKALERFQQEFKKIIFVVDARSDDGAARKLAEARNMALLSPPVDLEIEEKRYHDYRRTWAIVDPPSSKPVNP